MCIKDVNNQDNKSYFLERERDFEKIFSQERNLLEYGNKKDFITNLEKNYHNNLILFEVTKKNIFMENEKKSVLADIRSLRWHCRCKTNPCKRARYVNIFSQFTIFSEKNNEAFKYFTKNNKTNFFRIKKIAVVKNNFHCAT